MQFCGYLVLNKREKNQDNTLKNIMNLYSKPKLVFIVVKVQSSTRSTALLHATQVEGMLFWKMLRTLQLEQHKWGKLLCSCHLLTPAATRDARLEQ